MKTYKGTHRLKAGLRGGEGSCLDLSTGGFLVESEVKAAGCRAALPVDDERFVRSLLVAHRTRPRWLLLIHL